MPENIPKPSPEELELLSQLRDIHTPDAITWWPLAPIAWLLITAFILLCAFAVYSWRQHTRKGQYRKQALLEFNTIKNNHTQISANGVLFEVNALLKRCLFTVNPNLRKHVSSLHGTLWYQFLLTQLPTTGNEDLNVKFDTWTNISYTNNVNTEALKEYLLFAESWLKKHKRRKIALLKQDGDIC